MKAESIQVTLIDAPQFVYHNMGTDDIMVQVWLQSGAEWENITHHCWVSVNSLYVSVAILPFYHQTPGRAETPHIASGWGKVVMVRADGT